MGVNLVLIILLGLLSVRDVLLDLLNVGEVLLGPPVVRNVDQLLVGTVWLEEDGVRPW